MIFFKVKNISKDGKIGKNKSLIRSYIELCVYKKIKNLALT